MRTIIKFRKGGPTRYISHLDLMRTMNRAIRRAGIPAAYSQGFHPHIVMSFAQALGLGYLSQGEYMEISLDESFLLDEAIARLNAALPEGLGVLGCWHLIDQFPTLMAAVTAARWRVAFHEPVLPGLLEKLPALLEREAVEVVKAGKYAPVSTDIRRGILGIEQRGSAVELMLSAGSALNVRPELVVTAALGDCSEVKDFTRLELYTTVEGLHQPLHKICFDGDRYER